MCKNMYYNTGIYTHLTPFAGTDTVVIPRRLVLTDKTWFVYPWRWRAVWRVWSGGDVGYCGMKVGAGWSLIGWLACITIRIVLVGKG